MTEKLKIRWTKEEWKRKIINLSLIIIGSFVLAFGAGVFLVPGNINSGGLSGLGIIVLHLSQGLIPVDLFVAGAMVILLLIGLIFLGKEFTLNTLIASIVYPLALSLVLRVPFFQHIPSLLFVSDGDGISTSSYLIGGLFGGALTGIGVGLTFLGGGSTGGLDVLTFIMYKYLRIKQSVGSLILDASIVLGGMIILGDEFIVEGLIGVIAAVVCALMINFVFTGKSQTYVASIISKKWEAINVFIQDKLQRGTTIMDVRGGYQFDNYRMIIVVFSRREYLAFYAGVGHIDPKAFVTVTQAQNVFGEGFNHLAHHAKQEKRTND